MILTMLLSVRMGLAREKRPYTVDDLVAMQRISDPQPSPDGTRVAFVVKTMDLTANRGRTDIWIATIDGSGARRLTSNPANDWNPRWLDNSTICFLSARSKPVQVWRISAGGGRARKVTHLPVALDTLTVGPAGRALFVSAGIFPGCGALIQCTADRLAARARRKESGLIFDHLFVRHWDTWEDGRFNHILRVPLRGHGKQGGPAIDLMAGLATNSKPWGGTEDFTVSPDGKTVVYSAKAVTGSKVAWSTNYDLYAVPADGSGPRRDLTAANKAWDAMPTFSPDGKTLAYAAMKRPGYESDRFRVVLMAWPGGTPKVLTENWDRSPSDLVWSVDGKALFATADNLGNHSIFKIDAASGRVDAVVTKHSNVSPRPLPGGRLLFSQDSLVSPAELYVLGARGGAPLKITHLNDRRLAGLEFGTYMQFSFLGAHRDRVFGYLVYPVNFDPHKTYPLAFLIHGGPQGSFDDHWHYRWNPEIYASHGYATVMIDFHGSTGYGQGQAFTDAINHDWGGAPFEDLMRGLDVVLHENPWIDSHRMAALGASYGGWMINWIQGHTNRFRALVCHDGNLDEYMAYFETDELWFPEWEHGGTPWEHPEDYIKESPVQYLKHWKTPELVIHGAHDYRVVDTQGLGTFNALQRLGIPSRLLFFPDESHWVLKPLNSIQWHHVVLDWIDRWTKPVPGARRGMVRRARASRSLRKVVRPAKKK
ncbi:MAG: S9 family peptidase [Acidobacteria bacterium]|nr:S9 family peptidase [Acidobacteriota bacterium]